MSDFDVYIEGNELLDLNEIYFSTDVDELPEESRFEVHCREDYIRYLKTPHWTRRRAHAILRAGRRCEYLISGQRCHCSSPLQVHHKNYQHLWEELNTDLQVLCRTHHIVVELLKKICARCSEPVLNAQQAEELVAENSLELSNLLLLTDSRCATCNDPALMALHRLKVNQEYREHSKAALTDMVQRLRGKH